MDIDRLAKLEARIQRLEDRDKITDLAVEYCTAVDAFDEDALRAMFTDDARFYAANGEIDGRGVDAVLQVLNGRWDTILTSLHITHGHTVDHNPADPDRATGSVYSHAEVVRDGKPMLSALRYDDVYHRVDDHWRFAERCLSFFYYVDIETYTADLMSGKPVDFGGTPLPADLPVR